MLNLYVRLLDAAERSHLNRILYRLMVESRGQFRMVEASEANAVVISPDDPGSMRLIDSKKIVPIVYGPTPVDGVEWYIPKPGSSSDVAQTILGVSALFQPQEPAANTELSQTEAAPPAHASTPPRAADSETFSLGSAESFEYSRVVDVLQCAREQQQSVELTFAGAGPVYYLATTDDVYGTFTEIAGFLATREASENTGRTYQQRSLDDASLRRVVNKPNFFGYRMESLVWHAALALDDARIVDTAACYRLRRWPNFATLTYEHWYMKAAGILMRSRMSAQSLSVALDVPLDQACRFMSACDALGILELAGSGEQAGSSSAVPVKSKKSEKLLGKLLKRFFAK
ncbi:hypothetical protein E4634_14110 [Mangrovimicrobium sediminis]|uniref:Uncharacterized protein n=1 Tax=Mangrovimicrobium sediminis TaxID=2562682 RepID=A0A4Z0LZ54_9GAMM|nr:hypothetical protein [Haliea sp. SAOS-164]TGD72652.1 hypothetical protein E4634_14110 [Haliea sp. SAOS-164]